MRRLALLAFAALVAAGCGAEADDAAPAATPVLGAAAVPGLHSTVRDLDRTALAIATPLPGLAARLEDWSPTGAVQREFTGGERDLTHVVSRTVAFGSAAGAAAYGKAVATGAASYLGAGSDVHTLRAAGRSGWLVRPSGCGCRPEPPTVIAVLPEGRSVSWLEMTGDGATRARLVRLAERLP